VIEYLVDGRNRRVGKRVDGVLVQGYLYDDQLRILAELDGGSNVVATFVYGEGINVPELMVKGGRTYRLIKDQLGSVRLVVDTGDGSIMQEMRYDAWGNVTYDSNPGFQPFGFAGGLYDPQTRLVRFGARDYDAQLGRWMGKDPALFVDTRLCGFANLLAYACNAPTKYLDGNGLTVIDPNCKGFPVWDWIIGACRYMRQPACKNRLRRYGEAFYQCMRRKCTDDSCLVISCRGTWECGNADLVGCNMRINPYWHQQGRCGPPKETMFHEWLHLCGMSDGDHHSQVMLDCTGSPQ